MKKTLSTMLIVLAALLATELVQHFGETVSVAGAQGTGNKTIRLISTTTTASLLQDRMPEFKAKNPGVQLISHSDNNRDGFKALLEPRAHISVTTRKPKQHELDECQLLGFSVPEELLKDDGVAIVVNPANQVAALSIPQLAKIFNGQYTNWRQVGDANEKIQIVTTSPEGDTASFLSKTIFKMPFTDKVHCTTLTYAGQIPLWVSAIKAAIGFCRTSLAFESSRAKKVTILDIKEDDSSPAIRLSEETIRDGSYPIVKSSRVCYERTRSTKHAKEFVAFTREKAKTPRFAHGEK